MKFVLISNTLCAVVGNIAGPRDSYNPVTDPQHVMQLVHNVGMKASREYFYKCHRRLWLENMLVMIFVRQVRGTLLA